MRYKKEIKYKNEQIRNKCSKNPAILKSKNPDSDK